MLEAFLEEVFLCPEIIFTACLICPLKMLDPLCGVCLLEADKFVWFFFFPSFFFTANLDSLAYWKAPDLPETMIKYMYSTKIH